MRYQKSLFLSFSLYIYIYIYTFGGVSFLFSFLLEKRNWNVFQEVTKLAHKGLTELLKIMEQDKQLENVAETGIFTLLLRQISRLLYISRSKSSKKSMFFTQTTNHQKGST